MELPLGTHIVGFEGSPWKKEVTSCLIDPSKSSSSSTIGIGTGVKVWSQSSIGSSL